MGIEVDLGNVNWYNTSDKHYVYGDIWSTAWAKDGTLFMLADDFRGFQDELAGTGGRNVSICTLEGSHPRFEGRVLNDLAYLGAENELGDDDSSWKGSGIGAYGDDLFMFMSRQWYGAKSPDSRERKQDGYLLRSADQGRTWGRLPDRPMFPGPTFPGAYFVEYGKGGESPDVDRAAEFVYAVSAVGVWDNGDAMSLGRVARDKLEHLDARDWQFYRGGNGITDEAWGSLLEATSILSAPGRCGVTGMHFLPALHKYLVIQWHYPELEPGKPLHHHTRWEFYLGDHPWGPFECIKEVDWPETGLYCPYMPNKFMSADGLSGVLLASGNFMTSQKPWDQTYYQMASLSISFSTTP